VSFVVDGSKLITNTKNIKSSGLKVSSSSREKIDLAILSFCPLPLQMRAND